MVLNSGGANACTGPAGFADTHATAEHAAAALDIGAAEVAVCSTGLIGDRLPLRAVTDGIEQAAVVLAADGDDDAARAIMTTDTVPEDLRSSRDPAGRVGGMAKGAGMLAPALATMLCVHHHRRRPRPGDRRLRRSGPRPPAPWTGSTATAACPPTTPCCCSRAAPRAVTPAPADFAAGLEEVCADLSMQLLADAEGATKLDRRHRPPGGHRGRRARGGPHSRPQHLLKCALYGNDPNWGRVLAAVGTTKAAFEPDALDVAINGVAVCQAGAAGEPRDRVDLDGRDVTIDIDLHAGTEEATIWTTDLTDAYVHENSAYSS